MSDVINMSTRSEESRNADVAKILVWAMNEGFQAEQIMDEEAVIIRVPQFDFIRVDLGEPS